MAKCAIHSEVLGCGANLVLVHGWGMHSGVWRDFAQRLARHFRVTLLDLPGHGRSNALHDFSLDTISTVLMEKAPATACWLGWSLGATIVMNIAYRFPQRVAKAVTLAGNAKFIRGDDWDSGMEPALINDFTNELSRDKRATLKRFANLQVHGSKSQKFLLRKLRLLQNECELPTSSTLRGGLEILRTADLRESLQSLQVPGLLLVGENDALVPVGAGPAMQSLWKNAALQAIPESGHLPFLSHPAVCESAITAFVQPGL